MKITKDLTNPVRERMLFLPPAVQMGQAEESLAHFKQVRYCSQGHFAVVGIFIHRVSQREFALK